MERSHESCARGDASRASTRGRIAEREWRDIRRAARIARVEGVALKVHGVEVAALSIRKAPDKKANHLQKQPTDPVDPPKQQDEAVGDTPRPPTARQQHRAQRLREYQEKKRCELAAAAAQGEGGSPVVMET